MDDYIHNKALIELFSAILKLKNEDECRRFFRDLCTLEELKEMSRRWQAAKMLNQKVSYRDVADKTHLSTTTVSRVAYWLKNGAGGYQLILSRLKK